MIWIYYNLLMIIVTLLRIINTFKLFYYIVLKFIQVIKAHTSLHLLYQKYCVNIYSSLLFKFDTYLSLAVTVEVLKKFFLWILKNIWKTYIASIFLSIFMTSTFRKISDISKSHQIITKSGNIWQNITKFCIKKVIKHYFVLIHQFQKIPIQIL